MIPKSRVLTARVEVDDREVCAKDVKPGMIFRTAIEEYGTVGEDGFSGSVGGDVLIVVGQSYQNVIVTRAYESTDPYLDVCPTYLINYCQRLAEIPKDLLI